MDSPQEGRVSKRTLSHDARTRSNERSENRLSKKRRSSTMPEDGISIATLSPGLRARDQKENHSPAMSPMFLGPSVQASHGGSIQRAPTPKETSIGVWSTLPYQQGWKHLRGAWTTFHQAWWGDDGQTKLTRACTKPGNERILHIEQAEILSGFNLLMETSGRLLVRDEYLFQYKRLCEAFTSNKPAAIVGVVLTGQPGIGKSFFNVFLLLQRMAAQEPVLFTVDMTRSYLIDKYGVWSKKAQDIDISSDLPQLPNDGMMMNHLSERLWSIIEPGLNATAPPTTIIAQSLFIVFSCSPTVDRYMSFRSHNRIPLWIMQPWSDEELCALMNLDTPLVDVHVDYRKRYQSIESVAEVRKMCGPCPRDFLKWITMSTGSKDVHIDRAIQTVANAQEIEDILTETSTQLNKASHQLILVRRIDSDDPDATVIDDDLYSVEFKSDVIAGKLLKRHSILEHRSAQTVFRITSAVPASSTFGGWIFEALAIRYTRGAFDHPDTAEVVAAFAIMTRSYKRKRPSLTWYHIGPTSDTATDTLSVTRSEVTIAKESQDPSTDSSSSQTHSTTLSTQQYARSDSAPGDRQVQQALPINFREAVSYYDIDREVQMDPRYYYIPQRRNSPLFDAFFFEMADATTVIIWILQMTISKEHGGSSSGYDAIRALKKLVEDEGKTAVIRYTLVVPYKRHRSVKWEMPDGWDEEVAGDVFVQYLNISLRH